VHPGHVVHSSAQNVDALFFMLRWARWGLNKKHVRTCYAELVFLDLVGSSGQVVLSGVTGSQNVDALFLILGWAWYGFHKKRIGTR
jgi:hypothetical protein